MARVIIRDILIFMLIGTMVFSLMFAFVTSLGGNYGVTMPDKWQQFNNNISEDTISLYDDARAAEKSVESDSGIDETTSGDEFSLSSSAISAGSYVFSMPGIAISFITEVSKAVPIPDAAKYTLIGIILILALFTFISMLARKDT